MEILGQFWWVIALVVLGILVIITKNVIRKRAVNRRRADRLILQQFISNISTQERRTYAELPNAEARLEWLARTYPVFAAAAERYYPQAGLKTAAAYHLDIHILRGVMYYDDEEKAVRILQTTAIAMSLKEYQVLINERNEEQQKQEEERAKLAAKHRAEEQARRQREAAELAAKKKAAKKHWDSLSDKQKATFRAAKGTSARQQALMTSPYDPVTIFYPLIMAEEFGKVSITSSNSIDYCGTSSHSGYSSHSDGGSYSSSGSSYSSSDSSSSSSSSSDSGGGGGGGCD